MKNEQKNQRLATSKAYAWVKRATSARAMLPACRYIHAIGDWIVGTDGNRVHAIKNNGDLVPGSYDPINGKHLAIIGPTY